jgi:hypothetical protein
MTNHPKDRHVLAAAVAGRADILVTDVRGQWRPGLIPVLRREFACRHRGRCVALLLKFEWLQGARQSPVPSSWPSGCRASSEAAISA